MTAITPTMPERARRAEMNRRAWKASIKEIVPQIVCCGDRDTVVFHETARQVFAICGECQITTVFTQPGFEA